MTATTRSGREPSYASPLDMTHPLHAAASLAAFTSAGRSWPVPEAWARDEVLWSDSVTVPRFWMARRPLHELRTG